MRAIIPDLDPLKKFIEAQAGCYDRVVRELRCGRKESHWMWFIFPQLDGLGSSPMARMYAIKDIREAKAYLACPLLCDRLNECAGLVLAHRGVAVTDIFGYPDYMKLRSCMTLFERADPTAPLYAELLDSCFCGKRDDLTLALLARQKF